MEKLQHLIKFLCGIAQTSANFIGNINPIRYRGYYYDTDLGLYYLQSRYYDPETGRFVNGDAYAQTGTGLLDKNMFAYCLDDPVNMVDDSGACPYNGTAADFHRLEQGLPPIDCTCGKNTNAKTLLGAGYKTQIQLSGTVDGDIIGIQYICKENNSSKGNTNSLLSAYNVAGIFPLRGLFALFADFAAAICLSVHVFLSSGVGISFALWYTLPES